jgi:hypothetical protein
MDTPRLGQADTGGIKGMPAENEVSPLPAQKLSAAAG